LKILLDSIKLEDIHLGLFIYKELSLKDFFYIPEENGGDVIEDEDII
jgi:hypothetical protein